MDTTYFYVDESFRKHAGYWHCNIGGMILLSEMAVDIEIALEMRLRWAAPFASCVRRYASAVSSLDGYAP